MLTEITIEYLGNPARVGGRPEITDTKLVDVFWIPDIKIYGLPGLAAQRAIDLGAESMAVILLEDTLPRLDLQRDRVFYDSDYYKIVGMTPAPPDLGLEGTYTLYLKREKGLS